MSGIIWYSSRASPAATIRPGRPNWWSGSASAACCIVIPNNCPGTAAAGRDRPRARGKTAAAAADEPTGNLDEATADDVLALTRDLVARTGCGFLMVTHSERLAATLDRQVHLSAGASHDPHRLDSRSLVESLAAGIRWQLATLLIGLISATALWSGVQALNAQARSSTTARRRPSAARERPWWSAAP